MATAVVMPKQGQSVESCIIVDWKKQPGDAVMQDEVLCEVETDKAVLEVASPISGTLLARFYGVGDVVPVLMNIAAIGAPGEDASSMHPQGLGARGSSPAPEIGKFPQPGSLPDMAHALRDRTGVSPRARRLAKHKQLDLTSMQGSGPGGRVIERDVQHMIGSQPRLSPVARAMLDQGGFSSPSQGSGPGGRVMSHDLAPVESPSVEAATQPAGGLPINTIPLKGVRKVIADRMLMSVQSTAQLTLNATADARAILRYRSLLKTSGDALDIQNVTINDLVLFAVSRVLPRFPALNAWFDEGSIVQFSHVQLAFAVDTPRGLIVPVIRQANERNLRDLAHEGRRLATACVEGTVLPDELTGGTFTVTNLGYFGIESFSPILNPPQVAILGVGSIQPKAIEADGEFQLHPHIGLSLTINHQVVDGVPGARFLQALAQGIAQFELSLAM